MAMMENFSPLFSGNGNDLEVFLPSFMVLEMIQSYFSMGSLKSRVERPCSCLTLPTSKGKWKE
jgi:hypothetical protein